MRKRFRVPPFAKNAKDGDGWPIQARFWLEWGLFAMDRVARRRKKLLVPTQRKRVVWATRPGSKNRTLPVCVSESVDMAGTHHCDADSFSSTRQVD